MSTSVYRYQPLKRDESVLKMRIKEITEICVHYGYRRVHVMLRREGHFDNLNAQVESFNGRLRQECLNAHWFMSLADAQVKIQAWRMEYNKSRPHSALN